MPLQKIALPHRNHNPCPPITRFVEARRSQAVPEHWNLEEGNSAKEVDGQEREGIVNLFHSVVGTLHVVTSIVRIENKKLWQAFSSTCEDVALKNWGICNERQLFSFVTESFLRCPTCEMLDLGDVYSAWSRDSRELLFSSEPHFHFGDGQKKAVVSRVALGRVESHQRTLDIDRTTDQSSPVYHSALKLGMTEAATQKYTIRNSTQAYPEYIITFDIIHDQGSGRDFSFRDTESLAPQVVRNAQGLSVFQFGSQRHETP